MTLPIPVLIIIGLFISAKAKLTFTMGGQPVAVPALWLVAASVTLLLLALVMILVRIIVRDGGFNLRPRMGS